jgi:magnesium transporter
MVRKYIKKQSKKLGLSPGTIIHVGEKKVQKVHISLINYNSNQLSIKELKKADEFLPPSDQSTVSWLSVIGLHDTAVLERIGENLGIHPLVLEDIVNTDQRPKVDEYDDYIFVVIKMLTYNSNNKEIVPEQISILIGENYVLTFQEHSEDLFNPIKERLNNQKGRLRRLGIEYLAYALMDVIIDNYFLLLEKLGDELELLEENIVDKPDHKLVQEILHIKREILFFRKSIWPLREVINTLNREESGLISDAIKPYLQDLYDHTIQVIDTVETFRDMLSGILDVYLSNVSNRMNEVMKVLTIIATIFIPLTFIAGIYGMNFEFMPELKWHWGYPVILIIMFGIVVSLALYFRKKKWI